MRLWRLRGVHKELGLSSALHSAHICTQHVDVVEADPFTCTDNALCSKNKNNTSL